MSDDHVPAQVAIEVADGDSIGTTQVAREKNTSTCTVFRWIARGLPGADGARVRLEAVKRGRTWLTSRAALRRFFAALPTSANTPITPREIGHSQSLRHRAADAAQAKQQLESRYGIK